MPSEKRKRNEPDEEEISQNKEEINIVEKKPLKSIAGERTYNLVNLYDEEPKKPKKKPKERKVGGGHPRKAKPPREKEPLKKERYEIVVNLVALDLQGNGDSMDNKINKGMDDADKKIEKKLKAWESAKERVDEIEGNIDTRQAKRYRKSFGSDSEDQQEQKKLETKKRDRKVAKAKYKKRAEETVVKIYYSQTALRSYDDLPEPLAIYKPSEKTFYLTPAGKNNRRFVQLLPVNAIRAHTKKPIEIVSRGQTIAKWDSKLLDINKHVNSLPKNLLENKDSENVDICVNGAKIAVANQDRMVFDTEAGKTLDEAGKAGGKKAKEIIRFFSPKYNPLPSVVAKTVGTNKSKLKAESSTLVSYSIDGEITGIHSEVKNSGDRVKKSGEPTHGVLYIYDLDENLDRFNIVPRKVRQVASKIVFKRGVAEDIPSENGAYAIYEKKYNKETKDNEETLATKGQLSDEEKEGLQKIFNFVEKAAPEEDALSEEGEEYNVTISVPSAGEDLSDGELFYRGNDSFSEGEEEGNEKSPDRRSPSQDRNRLFTPTNVATNVLRKRNVPEPEQPWPGEGGLEAMKRELEEVNKRREILLKKIAEQEKAKERYNASAKQNSSRMSL